MGYQVGILGGMGPLATATLYELIVKKTKVNCDQDHIEMVILNKCSIPDRTKALVNKEESPLEKINEGIKELISLNCKYLIIPCNTAHSFKKGFLNLDKIEFIDMVESTKERLKKQKDSFKTCVLCTYGTKLSNVYTDDINSFYPDESIQKHIMNIITNTKAGDDCYNELKRVIKSFDICNQFLLACTELSIYYDRLINDVDLKEYHIYDAMMILVETTILKCHKQINNI